MRIWILVFAFASSAFASSTFIPGAENKMVAKGVMSLSVLKIIDKGRKFDMKLAIRNDNNQTGIIVFFSDMSCQRAGTPGRLKYSLFGIGERTIDFRPGQQKEMSMVCETEGTKKGPFKLMVAKIYDNPSLDGKTVGKVIANDLTWEQDDRQN